MEPIPTEASVPHLDTPTSTSRGRPELKRISFTAYRNGMVELFYELSNRDFDQFGAQNEGYLYLQDDADGWHIRIPRHVYQGIDLNKYMRFENREKEQITVLFVPFGSFDNVLYDNPEPISIEYDARGAEVSRNKLDLQEEDVQQQIQPEIVRFAKKAQTASNDASDLSVQKRLAELIDTSQQDIHWLKEQLAEPVQPRRDELRRALMQDERIVDILLTIQNGPNRPTQGAATLKQTGNDAVRSRLYETISQTEDTLLTRSREGSSPENHHRVFEIEQLIDGD